MTYTTIGLNDRQRRFDVLLTSPIEAMGYMYVGCEYIARRGCPVIRVYIDRDGGINADHCAEVSRQLRALIAAEAAVTGDYALEVSSPGIARPLFNADHFRQVLGQQAVLHLHRSLGGKRKVTGILRNMSGDAVAIESAGDTVFVPLANIAKATLADDLASPRFCGKAAAD